MGRRRALVLVAAAALAVSTACAPITTLFDYNAGDGSRVVLGDQVSASNILILTRGADQPALVVGGVSNSSADPVDVSIDFGVGDAVELSVDGNSTLYLNPERADGASVILPVSPGAPGASVSATITSPGLGSTNLWVPVLDGELQPYGQWIETYLPEEG